MVVLQVEETPGDDRKGDGGIAWDLRKSKGAEVCHVWHFNT